MKVQNTNSFIEASSIIHNFIYDYSHVNYVNTRTKVEIICKVHGSFFQTPNSHLRGSGCPKCAISKNATKRTDPTLFNNFILNNNGEYDYSHTKYVSSSTKVEIICKKHGPFWMLPFNHINGQGCPKCKSIKHNTSWFIEQANIKYKDYPFDYTKTTYINKRTKVCINCTKHGDFYVLPNNFLNLGQHCPKCRGLRKWDTSSFIEVANLLHNNKYSYQKVHFKNVSTKVCITCPKHGDFLQEPREHLRGRGCPHCKNSKGEIEISGILRKLNVLFETQKTFDWLIYKEPLKCDFYLPTLNIVIEFNGLQHYRPIKKWGGVNEYKKIVERDKSKISLCTSHNIKVYIIKYDDNVYDKLISILSQEGLKF